ncbi:hypothetical protein PsexTeo8_28440 [Pseudomonas extremaustralis]|nr:hypothetical protein [Pseudomonas extremaustralis]
MPLRLLHLLIFNFQGMPPLGKIGLNISNDHIDIIDSHNLILIRSIPKLQRPPVQHKTYFIVTRKEHLSLSGRRSISNFYLDMTPRDFKNH